MSQAELPFNQVAKYRSQGNATVVALDRRQNQEIGLQFIVDDLGKGLVKQVGLDLDLAEQLHSMLSAELELSANLAF